MYFKDHLYPEDPVLKLVNLISDNVEYLDQLVDFWELIEKNHKGEGNTAQFIKIWSSLFRTLLTYPADNINLLAKTFMESQAYLLLDTEEKTLPEYLPFQYFVKSFTLLIYYFVENLDIRSAQGFLAWAYQRIVKTSIYNIQTKKTTDLEHFVEVIFYSQDNVEFVLRQELRYKKGFHPFYFEELIRVNEATLETARNDPNCIITHQIREFDEILPTGISAESVLVAMQNNSFKTLDQFTHCFSSQFPSTQNVRLVATIPASLPASMPVAINSPTIGSYPILSAALTLNKKQVVGREFQFYRLNPYFIRSMLWAQHTNSTGKAVFYNAKSEFFSEEDFGINQIAKLNKRWEKKAVQAKKQLLSSQLQGQDLTTSLRSSNPEKRIPKDYNSLTRSIFVELYHGVQNTQDNDRLNEAIEFLDIVNNNKIQNLQTPQPNGVTPPFSSYITKFASAYRQLPRDSKNPYEDDVINYAIRAPLQIFLIGKPRSGRSTFAIELAKKLDIEYIDVLRPQLRIFDKVRENEENPQLDEEGNPKEFLTVLERNTFNALRDGKDVPGDALLILLNLELQMDAPINKGFILDLPIEQTHPINWLNMINQNKLKIPRIQCRHFTHIIHLNQSDQAVLDLAAGLMEKAEDFGLSSQVYRDELRRPKVKAVPQEGDDEEDPIDDEEPVKVLVEADLFFRPSEDQEVVVEQLRSWAIQFKKAEQFYVHMLDQQVIKIEAAGLTNDQLIGIALSRLPKVKAPLAIKLEGSSEKELLTLNLEEQRISRQWSQWQQIDPVELFLNEKAIPGKVEFACEYAGRVFLFDNEQNQAKFLGNPRKYLNKPPELPKSYNVAIVGPRLSGKKSIAKLLSDRYGWTLVDVESVIRDKVAAQKQQEQERHVPSTFDHRVNDIHLTEQEWKDFYRGGSILPKDVLPMILNYLKCPLQRKPVGWGEPKKEEDPDDQQAQLELQEQKKKEAAKKNLKKKKEDEKIQEEPQEGEAPPKPATPPPEDVPTKEIIPLLDADSKVSEQAKPKGVIMVGYPHTQEQIELMNLFGFKLDKVIVLVDRSEETGQVLLQRPGFVDNYNLEQEMAYSSAVGATLKEAYGEENVKEIPIDGSVQDIWVRVQTQLDPIYIRVDDESLVRTPGDLQEGDDPLPIGNYANCCAVTLRESGWMVPGKDDLVSLVRGQVYKFYAEKEQTQFRENVAHYLVDVIPPPPRIMFIAVRGSGLTTQLNILNQHYKLPLLYLRENLLTNLKVHKNNRQQERYFMRGFKAPEVDADGVEIPDAEIIDDPADFDRKQHEIDLVNGILKNVGGVFIDGNFFDVPEDLLSTSIVELLVEARKLPEFVVFFKIDQKTYLERNFDTKVIQKEYQTKMAELKARRQQERVDARKKAVEDGVPEEELPSLDPPEGGDEEDPEAPKLEEMINEKKEKYVQQHEADSAKIEELLTQFTEELKIPATVIQTDTTMSNVADRIHTALQPYLDPVERANILERAQTFKLNPYPDPENFKINRLQVYEQSYTHQQSRYGSRNALTLLDVPHIRDFPLLYRNRIYYFNSEEERDKVAKLPLHYLKQRSVPTDVLIKPIVFVLGKPKSGKTTIAKLLSSRLKLTRVKVSYILEQYIQYQQDPLANRAKESILRGASVDDATIIAILTKRTQEEDCHNNGWILDGYPQTRDQALALTRAGMIPTVVFAMETDQETIKKRGFSTPGKYGSIDTVLQIVTQFVIIRFPMLTNYYQTYFNNVRYLSTIMSNWGLVSICEKYLNQQMKSRADVFLKLLFEVARALITQDPVNVSALTLTEQQIIQKLSPMLNYCPISLKLRQFSPLPLRSSHILYYDDKLYFCCSEKSEQDFIENPTNYVANSLAKYNLPIPGPLARLDRGAILEYQGKCPVSLVRGQLENGLSHLIVVHKKKWFAFSDAQSMQQFEHNPKLFKRAHLPDKLPLVFERNKNIAKKVAKRGDCTSYLELNLRNIIIRVLAQLGYKRMKYPTLSCKETVLKFIAISLKANNPNKDHLYRAKYQKKLNEFLRHCEYPQEIQEQAVLKRQMNEKGEWQPWNQENLLKMTEQFDSFMTELQGSDKQKYFYKFIR